MFNHIKVKIALKYTVMYNGGIHIFLFKNKTMFYCVWDVFVLITIFIIKILYSQKKILNETYNRGS